MHACMHACMHSDVVQPRCSLTPKTHTANLQPSVRLHLSPNVCCCGFETDCAAAHCAMNSTSYVAGGSDAFSARKSKGTCDAHQQDVNSLAEESRACTTTRWRLHLLVISGICGKAAAVLTWIVLSTSGGKNDSCPGGSAASRSCACAHVAAVIPRAELVPPRCSRASAHCPVKYLEQMRR